MFIFVLIQDLKKALLTNLAWTLKGWAEAILARLESDNQTQESAMPEEWFDRISSGPPAHWVERVRLAAPELLQANNGDPHSLQWVVSQDADKEALFDLQDSQPLEDLQTADLPTVESEQDAVRETYPEERPDTGLITLPRGQASQKSSFRKINLLASRDRQKQTFPPSDSFSIPRDDRPKRHFSWNFLGKLTRLLPRQSLFPSPALVEPTVNSTNQWHEPTGQARAVNLRQAVRNDPKEIQPLSVQSQQPFTENPTVKKSFRYLRLLPNHPQTGKSALPTQIETGNTEFFEAGHRVHNPANPIGNRVRSIKPWLLFRKGTEQSLNSVTSPVSSSPKQSSIRSLNHQRSKETGKTLTVQQPTSNSPLNLQSKLQEQKTSQLGRTSSQYFETEVKRFIPHSESRLSEQIPENPWPELPDVPEFSIVDEWTALLRSQEYLERLDREQRG